MKVSGCSRVVAVRLRFLSSGFLGTLPYKALGVKVSFSVLRYVYVSSLQ